MRLVPPALLAATLFAAPAFAEDLAFTLVNNSSATLQEMYVSSHDSNSWGDNILDANVDPNGTATVSIADGLTVCDYDMRFVMDTGVTADATQDVCKIDTFTLHD